jgi:hypothetical protein
MEASMTERSPPIHPPPSDVETDRAWRRIIATLRSIPDPGDGDEHGEAPPVDQTDDASGDHPTTPEPGGNHPSTERNGG